jgi:hypothetical protein
MNNHQAFTVKGLTIAPELFDKGFPAQGGPCTCSSRCCSGGVYADVIERDAILAHKDMIQRHMDDSQVIDESLWFDTTEAADEDFPSGMCVGTEVHNDKCVFLDKRGFCSLQVAATEEGHHKWMLKPLFCILYPIEISEKTVGFDPMLQEDEQCCSAVDRFDVPLFEGCREELVHLLGEDGFASMREHYSKMRLAGRHVLGVGV